jgi:hypothetical protein
MGEESDPAAEAPPFDPALLKETERLEQLALNLESAMPVRSLPRQEYLQATVIPLLLEGMAWIIKERPDDPVENLAMFLIKNNPLTPELHRSLDLSEFE